MVVPTFAVGLSFGPIVSVPLIGRSDNQVLRYDAVGKVRIDRTTDAKIGQNEPEMVRHEIYRKFMK